MIYDRQAFVDPELPVDAIRMRWISVKDRLPQTSVEDGPEQDICS